jgi:hypothetical protein
MASVPVLAIAQARLFGIGVTLWLAIVSIAVVLGSGAVALVLRGAAAGRPGGPVLPRPPRSGMPALALIVVGSAWRWPRHSACGSGGGCCWRP